MLPVKLYHERVMPLGTRHLRVGCLGHDVLALQRELVAAGYLSLADGRFGFVTEEAVRRLQSRSRLNRDGVAGPATIAELRALRAGRGFLVHRVRPGESEEQLAAELGVTREALRRQNCLSPRDKIVPGRLVVLPARAVIADPGEEPPPTLKCSAILGPRLIMGEGDVQAEEPLPPKNLPVLVADVATWTGCLRQSGRWPAVAESVRRLCSDRPWSIDLPPYLWRHRRRLLGFLAALAQGVGRMPMPIVGWPGAMDPFPDLKTLVARSDYLFLDPGQLVFAAKELIRLLRQLTAVVPARRLILKVRAGGLLRTPTDVRLLPVREARVVAATARARLSWEETDQVYRAVHQAEDGGWELRLLEARSVQARVRLIDRFGLAGVVLSGLVGLSLPRERLAEFAVLDSFPPAGHID